MFREAELGQVNRIIADPELGEPARATRPACRSSFSAAGAEPRELGAGLTDMERIDPDDVELPAWYEPNPGRASDLAFILFTGEGERTRPNRISNGRWVISAFGTASSAALTPSDTVYSVTPVYHPSGLLMSIGGAVAGGARLALARSFDPKTFWDEVRRYGVTVSAYTWTMLRDLVEAPEDARERHHPVRLFIGSGMPRGTLAPGYGALRAGRRPRVLRVDRGRRRARERLGLEAGLEGAAASGQRRGQDRRLRHRARASSRRARTGSRSRRRAASPACFLPACAARRSISSSETPLRGLFEPGDAWLPTGDLFHRDVDGDYWLVAHAHALVSTADGHGRLQPDRGRARRRRGGRPRDRLRRQRPGHEIAVAAVTVREATSSSPKALTERPVRPRRRRSARPSCGASTKIPVTTWYRPLTGPLRKQGIPNPDDGPSWIRDPDSGDFAPMDEASRARLLTGD